MCALWFTMGKTDKLPRDFCHFGFIRKLNPKKNYLLSYHMSKVSQSSCCHIYINMSLFSQIPMMMVMPKLI